MLTKPCLPPEWLAIPLGEEQPMWIDIARDLFSGQWSREQIDHVLRWTVETLQDHHSGGLFGDTFQRERKPEDILLLAAHANGWHKSWQTHEPTCLQEQLLQVALSYGHHAPLHLPSEQLELTQMLVYGSGIRPRSRLLGLHLKTIDNGTDCNDNQNSTRLIADVGASLIGMDADFQRGLQQVQALLNDVAHPDAPVISWRFDLLPLEGDSIESFDYLEGSSATAALAYGALYLLRRHLKTDLPHVKELARNLLIIEDPASVSITAQFASGDTTHNPWPCLEGVGGAPEKLAGLDTQLPTGRFVPHRFVASNQRKISRVASIAAHEASDIADLVRQIATLTSQLNDDARLLQATLLALPDHETPSEPATIKAMQNLATSTAPGSGVRAHLLWRYAQLCTGQPRPFGNVAQIGQHFVQLTVSGPPINNDATDAPANAQAPHENLERPDLHSIFYPTDEQDQERWRAVPAWVILAPPFSGKTTLINHWEITRIRAALREQRATGRWGEVPVFLPMNAFTRISSLNTFTADALGQALRQYAKLLAPALPWDELLTDHLPTSQQLNTRRPDGLRLRLCIDALNEYRTGYANENDAITRLCEWLAPRSDPQRPGALLPPLFSVRREEKGSFALRIVERPYWYAHEINVKAWSPSQMRAYILQRQLPSDTEAKLLQALELPGSVANEEALRSADTQGPANALAKFFTVPGFLSAQCSLLAHWPHLQLSERRADVMLALAWYCLDRWRHSGEFQNLKTKSLTDPQLANLLRWLLPERAQNMLNVIASPNPLAAPPSTRWQPGQAGGLLEGLTRIAEALQDANGGAREAAPWDDAAILETPLDEITLLFRKRDKLSCEPITKVLPPLSQAIVQLLESTVLSTCDQSELVNTWLAQANASGLAIRFQQAPPGEIPQTWMRFSHQQIQEFFAALSIKHDALPDLKPPIMPPHFLIKQNSDWKLELPAVTPHTERMRYAADLASPKGAEQLIVAVLGQGNLALAARLAIDQRQRLEPPIDSSGRIVSLGHWFTERRHPLLQHIRARLLLASVDTGSVNLPKLHASGILASIADAVELLSEPWLSQWALLLPTLRDPIEHPPLVPIPIFLIEPTEARREVYETRRKNWGTYSFTEGEDLRERLDYGLLLGELGDNIRYERCTANAEHNWQRTGIRLKSKHWAHVPASGSASIHRIGDERYKHSHPEWEVPPGALPEARFANTPTVVMQWQAYVDDQHALGLPAPELRALQEPRWSNPLLPITTINWYEAQAFTAWATPLHINLFQELEYQDQPPSLSLPTEAQYEAAIRYNHAQNSPGTRALWPHDPEDRRNPEEMDRNVFNHNSTRWNAPAPVGVFSEALTPTGIEAMGNVWTWCASEYTESYNERGATNAQLALTCDQVTQISTNNTPPLIVLRGGSFVVTADFALAAYRGRGHPDVDSNSVGLRWQLSYTTYRT